MTENSVSCCRVSIQQQLELDRFPRDPAQIITVAQQLNQGRQAIYQSSPTGFDAFCNRIMATIDRLDFEKRRTTLKLLQIHIICDRREDPPRYTISGLVPSDAIDSGQSKLSLQ